MKTLVNITVYKRVPFGGATGDGDIPIAGVNWASGAFKLEIRALPGDTGTAMLALVTAAAGVQGVSATYDPAYVLPTGAVAGATIVRIQIDEATIEAFALAVRPSDPLVLAYDLHVTPTGEPKRVICSGSFTVDPGVTI